MRHSRNSSRVESIEDYIGDYRQGLSRGILGLQSMAHMNNSNNHDTCFVRKVLIMVAISRTVIATVVSQRSRGLVCLTCRVWA